MGGLEIEILVLIPDHSRFYMKLLKLLNPFISFVTCFTLSTALGILDVIFTVLSLAETEHSFLL